MPANNISPSSNPQGSKLFLLGFFLCCSLPFMAAKLALEFSWFNAGVGSRGQWLEREIQLLPPAVKPGYPLSSAQASQQQWSLVYVQAQACDSGCERGLYTMQQLYLGLTGQQEKISLVILADKTPQQLNDFPAISWRPSSVSLDGLENQIFIVNQQGIAILRYSAAQDSQQILQLSRDIRKDLRRLLAFDRGGV